MKTLPSEIIDEPIEVSFDVPPTYEKRPDCPNSFIWRGQTYLVKNILNERQDFSRRGRSGRNMQPAHMASASRVGSWGVGRYYFCVEVNGGEIFEIYFDRAPQDAGDRKGHWFLRGKRHLVQGSE